MRHSASSDPLEIELHQGLEFIKRKQESKKKERKHALDQESDQENDQEKKAFSFKNLNQFYYQTLIICVSFS